MCNDNFFYWLSKQNISQNKLFLIIDSCADSNLILEFFKSGITSLKNFICLYKNTELEKSIESSPWLVELNNDFSINQISHLLETPETNWGWLASMDSSFTLEQLAEHWKQRIIIEEESRKFIYRFQDNRTISWHLQNLSETDISLLLGPINSVLIWAGEHWQIFPNSKPMLYPTLSNTPWVDISEQEIVTKEIRFHNMKNWLFFNYKKTIYEYSEIEGFHEWLEKQLLQLDKWNWNDREQWEFFLGQTLDPKQRISTEWLPLNEETPDMHYARCKKNFNKPLSYIETYINTELL